MSPCSKCGAANATVHLTQIFNGISTKSDYCEACFDQISPGVSQQAKARRAKMDELLHNGGRFTREAFGFVLKSLTYALKLTGSRKMPHHISARELIEAAEPYAKETWGSSAKAELKSWGIETASDVGEIVFLLVENGILGKREEDRREDFDGLPFLED